MSGPSVDGPSVGGPGVGEPSVGGRSVGGPSVGGPSRSVGEPSVDGPSVGVPIVGGLGVGGCIAPELKPTIRRPMMIISYEAATSPSAMSRPAASPNTVFSIMPPFLPK